MQYRALSGERPRQDEGPVQRPVRRRPPADSPYYVGFSVDGAEIGLVPSGHDQGMTGPVPFYDVDDIDATIAALQAAGGKLVQEPTDVGAGLLVAEVSDPDGNDIGLRQPPTTP
jgi:predicted enzyme related to lactoylglutathione lyase